MQDYKQALGSAVKRARTNMDMTQIEVADAADIDGGIIPFGLGALSISSLLLVRLSEESEMFSRSVSGYCT